MSYVTHVKVLVLVVLFCSTGVRTNRPNLRGTDIKLATKVVEEVEVDSRAESILAMYITKVIY